MQSFFWSYHDSGFPEDLAINPLTLRFRKNQTEQAFAASQKDVLLRNFFIATLATFALLMLLSLWIYFTRQAVQTQDPHSIVYAVVILAIVFQQTIMGASMIALCCRKRWSEYANVDLIEIWAVLILLGACLTNFFAVGWYTSKVFQKDPDTLYARQDGNDWYWSDSRLLMGWVTVQMASHIALPVRWHKLVFIEVFGSLAYLACIGLGSPEGRLNSWLNLLQILSINIFVAVGKRKMERGERLAMVQLLREKTLRFQSDYELSKVQTAGKAKRDEEPLSNALQLQASSDVRSQSSSAGPTEMTGIVFSLAGSSGRSVLELTWVLDFLKSMGRREHWLIDSGSLELNATQILGRGSWGIVLAGTLHGTDVAVKAPLSLDLGERCKALANELRVLRHIRHPHIVYFHGACIDPMQGELVIVEELVSGPSLKAAVLDPKIMISFEQEREILLSVAKALRYLHSSDPVIVHGDISPQNVMLAASLSPKLTDFGLSRVLAGAVSGLGGTLAYRAPETFQPSSPYPSADVFSFGRLAYFVVCQKIPLAGMAKEDLLKLYERKQVPSLHWSEEPSFNEERCKELVQNCCRYDALSRVCVSTCQVQISRWCDQSAGIYSEVSSSESPTGSFCSDVSTSATSWVATLQSFRQRQHVIASSKERL